MYERSYHAKVIKKDPKIERRERARARFKKIIFTVSGILLVVGIVLIMRIPQLQIKKVAVTGTEVVDPVDIEQSIFATLAGKYLFIFPKTNVLLAPLKKVKAMLVQTYPRLQSVALSHTTPTTLNVVVTEYHATYLWCTTAEQCYLMDQNGMVYSEAPYFSGNVYPKVFIGDLQSVPFSPLNAQQLQLVSTVQDRLAQLNIPVTEFHFEAAHTMRVVFLHNGQTALLYMDPSLDSNKTLDVFYSGLHADPLAGLFANQNKVLEYIDLRYSDKVVYKFQE